jgi:hypothetical protein
MSAENYRLIPSSEGFRYAGSYRRSTGTRVSLLVGRMSASRDRPCSFLTSCVLADLGRVAETGPLSACGKNYRPSRSVCSVVDMLELLPDRTEQDSKIISEKGPQSPQRMGFYVDIDQ